MESDINIDVLDVTMGISVRGTHMGGWVGRCEMTSVVHIVA